MEPAIFDALLVVVAKKHEADRIERALVVRSIPCEVRRHHGVIEFGGALGASPYEVYVRSQDLAPAKRVLEGLNWAEITAPGGPFSI